MVVGGPLFDCFAADLRRIPCPLRVRLALYAQALGIHACGHRRDPRRRLTSRMQGDDHSDALLITRMG